GPAGSYTYRFAWTPEEQHGGNTFNVTLQMGYTVEYLTSVEYEVMTEELVIHVLPLSGETITSVVLASELVIDDANIYPAGDAISLERIEGGRIVEGHADRKSTRLNSSHVKISYAVFCLKKKTPHVALTEDVTGMDSSHIS